ncbi:MAG: MCE family protein [Acidimicrobiales bacterium]
MKRFRERNLLAVAAVAAAVFLIAGYLALNFSHLPLVANNRTYHANLATAVGLQDGDVVTIAGVRVGSITRLSLGEGVVSVAFTVGGGFRLGVDTRADARIINPVGVEYLALTPGGPGHLHGAIPLSRTSVPATLISDLNQLTVQTQQTNIPQLVKSLEVVSQTLAGTSPAQIKAALVGVAQLSQILAARQSQVTDLITQADALTSELNSHSAQLVNLLGQADLVLQVLNARKQAITKLLTTTSALSTQISHIVVADDPSLQPLLANLQSVSTYLAKDAKNLNQAIPLLAGFDRYVSNATGSGPFADFVAPTLTLPDNLLAQCNAAGSLSPLLGCRP